jgi:hypothetical protein
MSAVSLVFTRKLRMTFTRRALIITLLLGGLGGAASAQESASSSAPGTAGPELGKWTYEEQASELDQRRTRVARLQAENQVANILGRLEQPHLSLRCDKDGLFALFIWPDFIQQPSFLTIRVRWKLDDGPVQTSSWIPSLRAVGPVGKGAQTWIRQLAGAKRLVVEVPDDHGEQEAVFDLTGIDVLGPRFSEVSCGG